MTGTTIAIRVRGLSKRFGAGAVLSKIDLDVAGGESVALVGANGSGKTTLLRCLAGVVRPSSGEVRWFGRPAAASAEARRLVGMVAHESFLYPHLTVRENLLFAARMHDVPEAAQRVDQLIRSVGLQAHARQLAARISKGMRQRAAVLRALVHDPRILVLDEPFSGLDVEGADWLVGLLRELCGRGTTMCISMHDKGKARSLADRVLCLQSGRLRELEPDRSGASAEDHPAARAA
jgi:heme ABC exporter ATP-binding subunit CcmA